MRALFLTYVSSCYNFRDYCSGELRESWNDFKVTQKKSKSSRKWHGSKDKHISNNYGPIL